MSTTRTRKILKPKRQQVKKQPSVSELIEMLVCKDTGISDPKKAMAYFFEQCSTTARQKTLTRAMNARTYGEAFKKVISLSMAEHHDTTGAK